MSKIKHTFKHHYNKQKTGLEIIFNQHILSEKKRKQKDTENEHRKWYKCTVRKSGTHVAVLTDETSHCQDLKEEQF